jgi:hypothetical protein
MVNDMNEAHEHHHDMISCIILKPVCVVDYIHDFSNLSI